MQFICNRIRISVCRLSKHKFSQLHLLKQLFQIIRCIFCFVRGSFPEPRNYDWLHLANLLEYYSANGRKKNEAEINAERTFSHFWRLVRGHNLKSHSKYNEMRAALHTHTLKGTDYTGPGLLVWFWSLLSLCEFIARTRRERYKKLFRKM